MRSVLSQRFLVLHKQLSGLFVHNNKMIKHIWFDFDGTLTYETAQQKLEHDKFATVLFAEIMGLPNNEDTLRQYIQHRKENNSINSRFLKTSPVKTASSGRVNYLMDNASLYSHEDHEDVRKLLKELSGQLPISIFTNTSQLRLRRVMEHLGYDTALFNHIIAGEDVPERKPSVMAYNYIVELSGLPASETMYVGDRVAGDIVPSKSAGMQTVLVGMSLTKETLV